MDVVVLVQQRQVGSVQDLLLNIASPHVETESEQEQKDVIMRLLMLGVMLVVCL